MNAIYNPKGQAQEYGEWAANPYRGCGHKCAYCYVPAVLKMSRADFDAGAVLRDGFLQAFEKDAKKLQKQGKSVNIFFSFTTDLYHPGDTSSSRSVLEITREYGHSFTVLTKGGMRALRDLDLYRPGVDHFASTLTSLSADISEKWERGAASPYARMETLNIFHDAGIFTWASLEPAIDIEQSIAVLYWSHRFVDFFKIGRVNYLPMTKTTDWKDYTLRMLELTDKLGVARYFKKDLQGYLPEGTPNEPLRPGLVK